MAHTRRSFLAMTVGAASLLPQQRAWADEPALETTSVRLPRSR
jgi:hypothetical protein